MGSGYLTSPLILIINTLLDLYVLLVLLRFMLQWIRADFYNPVSQFVVKATTPLLKPLRRIIPGLGGQDIAALVLALAVILIKFGLLMALGANIIEIAGQPAAIGAVSIVGLFVIALAEMVAMIINIFLFAVIVMVIMSWVNPGGYNPVIGLIDSLCRPIMRPIRRIIPAMGGLDLSPLFASLGLIVLKMLLIPPILYLANQM
jgi:YggT family protein